MKTNMSSSSVILREERFDIIVSNAIVEKIGAVDKFYSSIQVIERTIISFPNFSFRYVMASCFDAETHTTYVYFYVFGRYEIEIDPIPHALGQTNVFEFALVGHDRFHGKGFHDVQHLQPKKFGNKSSKIGIDQYRNGVTSILAVLTFTVS